MKVACLLAIRQWFLTLQGSESFEYLMIKILVGTSHKNTHILYTKFCVIF